MSDQIIIREVDGLIVVDWPDPPPRYVSITSADFAACVDEINAARRAGGAGVAAVVPT